MRKSRFTEAQIVGILKELDAARPAVELARKHGVHINTLRLWRSKYGGLETSDLVRLKELEAENSEMERIIARQALEIRAMSEERGSTRIAARARRSSV
jgi:putative transposase